MGETSQLLKVRLSQHQTDVENQIRRTALTIHAKEEKHVFDFDNTSILAREDNTRKRKLLEVINITRNNTVNYKTDTANLCTVYKIIIRDYSSSLSSPARSSD